ncbi:MAG: adenylate/guanylate cyclase domain-containing protein [Proteobacteria bacterium]|nr:adenylate/guanylate cyclase domain-containing protein [Pseudomonadota bacterium]
MNLKFDELRQHRIPLILGAVVVLFFLLHVVGLAQLGIVQRLEQIAYDMRLNHSLPGGVDKRIVIVDIDEQTLATEGRWPWSRNKLKLLVDRLFDDYGISVLGFDMVFAEADEQSALRTLRHLAKQGGDHQLLSRLDRLSPQLDFDRHFASAIKGRPVVLGYYFDSTTGNKVHVQTGQLPTPLFERSHFPSKMILANKAMGFGANLPILQKAAVTAGHFDNPLVDGDGIFRRVPLLQEYDGGLYESLALAIARTYLKAEVDLEFVQGFGVRRNYPALEWIKVGFNRVPVDEEAAVLVPFRGPQGSFPYVSATHVLRKQLDNPDLLKDAIVLVGTTAPGLQDMRATPVQSVYSGVEIHANIVAGILDESFMQQPAYILGVDFVTVLLLGLFLTILLPLLRPWWVLGVVAATLFVVMLINSIAWYGSNTVIPIASSGLLILTLFVINMSYGFFEQSRGKWALGRLFGQYVPPEMVEEMVEGINRGSETYSLAGEKREMTVLFSDVRGFSRIAEGLDPKQLSELMNEFLTTMTRIIHKHRGTIDKYMGDAIMAFWGAPVAQPDHADLALAAAVEMVTELQKLREKFRLRGWPELRVGIGLNTGEMNVGNMGSEFRMAYTVIGDAVNLGSRLEGLTKRYGANILVGEATRNSVASVVFREVDRVRVKGKDKPVTVFEPVGLAAEVTNEEKQRLTLHRDTIKLYRRQEWDQAELQFLNLQKEAQEDPLYRIYLERIAYFRKNPPGQDWDGVSTYQNK